MIQITVFNMKNLNNDKYFLKYRRKDTSLFCIKLITVIYFVRIEIEVAIPNCSFKIIHKICFRSLARCRSPASNCIVSGIFVDDSAWYKGICLLIANIMASYHGSWEIIQALI